jgi:tetratricopeptide (TPR) repeat protein/tRNA A-37 threonylcarbamoyl transferase component Bud32
MMTGRSQTIGPYTLERQLGAGGMGEVYQAYDRRLDRRVAVKVIRSGQTANETARERFRREARAAACLQHPSIVQIHDIVETEFGDAIVMELVLGDALAHRLANGPLPLAEAVRIGREIAEGLAVAHERGIVHRDLKPENVMLTESGHAKILDFGLAKQLTGEVSLTQDQKVVGTFRSMSPEQARCLPVDARSDLFALGILLYEMLAGKSPFEGSSAFETLTQICTHRQTPLRELNPAISAPLSALVDRLLEKEPSRRPQTAREVAAALERAGSAAGSVVTVAAGETGGATATTQAESQPWIGRSLPARQLSSQGYRAARPVLRWTVLLGLLAALATVLSFRLGNGQALVRSAGMPVRVALRRAEVHATAGTEESAELLASSLESSLLRSLLGFQGISPLPPSESKGLSGSLVVLARALAAEEVLTARLDCVRERCQVALERVRGSDGRILWSSRGFNVDPERPYLVEEAVAGYLADAYQGFPRQAGAVRLSVRPEDYTKYLRLQKTFEAKRAGESLSPDDLLAELQALRASSPQFLDAYVFESEVRQQRYKSRQEPTDLDRAEELLERARQLAPADPRPLSGQFGVALLRGQWDRAEEALVALERLQPGDPGVLVNRARLLEKRGESDKALGLMRQAVRRFPSRRNLLRAARMEFAQGHFAEARKDVLDLLANDPESYDGLTLLAEIELLHGDLHRAADLYSHLIERYPRPVERSNLGMAEMYLGDYRGAEASFRQVLEAEPKNAFTLLNLADTVSLLGRPTEAAPIYRQVVHETSLAATDWQVLSARAQALAHLKDSPGAVEAVQKMLRIGPEGAQVACDASLVYVLLGDRNAALYNARRALAQGIEPRMFVLPWFDPLRQDPAFAAGLLSRSPS